MLTIVESIRRIVEDEIRKLHLCEVGEITSVFPHSINSDKDNYECNVRLKDKGVELRKVPVAISHIGLAHIPHVGDLVILSFINGDINAPIITGRLYNDEDRPPTTKMEEIVYQPPYTKDPKLRRINVNLPDGVLNLTLRDDSLDLRVGNCLMNIKSNGNIHIVSTEENRGDNRVSQIELTSHGGLGLYVFSNEGYSELELAKGGKCQLRVDTPDKRTSKILMDGIKVSVDSDYPLEIHSKEPVTMKSDKSVNITAGSQAGGASSLALDSTGNLTLKGSGGSVETSGDLTLKGSTVKIN